MKTSIFFKDLKVLLHALYAHLGNMLDSRPKSLIYRVLSSLVFALSRIDIKSTQAGISKFLTTPPISALKSLPNPSPLIAPRDRMIGIQEVPISTVYLREFMLCMYVLSTSTLTFTSQFFRLSLLEHTILNLDVHLSRPRYSCWWERRNYFGYIPIHLMTLTKQICKALTKTFQQEYRKSSPGWVQSIWISIHTHHAWRSQVVPSSTLTCSACRPLTINRSIADISSYTTGRIRNAQMLLWACPNRISITAMFQFRLPLSIMSIHPSGCI